MSNNKPMKYLMRTKDFKKILIEKNMESYILNNVTDFKGLTVFQFALKEVNDLTNEQLLNNAEDLQIIIDDLEIEKMINTSEDNIIKLCTKYSAFVHAVLVHENNSISACGKSLTEIQKIVGIELYTEDLLNSIIALADKNLNNE